VRTIIPFLALILLVSLCFAQSDGVRTMRSTPTNSPILDGNMDSLWWAVPVQTDFTEYNPTEGVRPSQRTDVRVMHSASALYVSFRSYDTDRTKILSPLTKHDRLGDCDQVTLYLDPYHDHRTGYFFTTNPIGVQQEGVFSTTSIWMSPGWRLGSRHRGG